MKENLHLAMIMDGNRRWAVKNGLPKLEGHKKGAENLRNVIKWCEQLKVRALTLYAMSTENFNRTEIEKQALFMLFKKCFKEILESDEVKEKKIKIKFLGNLSMFPKDLQELMNQVEKVTNDNDGFRLNFCMAYGGRQEILNAVNKAIKAGKELTEEEFENNLYMKDSPEIVIRTGGKEAMRTSNFLPWQTAYSEWFFLKTYWPALTKEELVQIIDEFESRKRNFGK